MRKTLNVLDKIIGALCIIVLIRRFSLGYDFENSQHVGIAVCLSVLNVLCLVITAWRLFVSRDNANAWDTIGGLLVTIWLVLTIGSSIVFKDLISHLFQIIVYVYAAFRLFGKYKDGTLAAGGCFASPLIIVMLLLQLGISLLLAHWFCDIDPEKTYHWWNGIWHGIFFIPNLLLHWINNDILFKAHEHAGGYNFFFWVNAILSILVPGGAVRKSYGN